MKLHEFHIPQSNSGTQCCRYTVTCCRFRVRCFPVYLSGPAVCQYHRLRQHPDDFYIGTVKQEIPAFGSGQVQLASELWTAELAEGDEAIPKGARVEVVEIQGIRLKVRAVSE